MTDSVSSPAFPDLTEWSRAQAACATQPLEFCADFPRIASRHEAWWRRANPGPPIFLASANIDPAIPGGRCLELLDQPEKWLEARLAQLTHTHLVGDALPSIRVDYGPVCLGMLLGAPVEFFSGTTWTHAFINQDWSNAPDWRISPTNTWWRRLPQLLRLNAAYARGRYLVMTPSLGGSADVLLNLRGSNTLSLDVFDQPEKIQAAVAAIYPSWRTGFETIWSTILAEGVGAINWVGLWSDQPYAVQECDFNYMIGPRAFQQLFLPDIARQAGDVGRAIFHLDGPGAARHYRALLDTPAISAIQYVTGAGNSALAHLDMFKAIQRRGLPLQVTVPAHEAVELSRQLEPNGLCLLVEEDLGVIGLETLYQEVCKPFRS